MIGLPKPSLHRDMPTIAADYDAVVIDGPPRVNELARSAIMASDVVLVPVQPSPYDVWAAEEIITLLKEASIYKEKLKSAFVINRKIVNTAIGRDVKEALSEYPLPVLAITDQPAGRVCRKCRPRPDGAGNGPGGNGQQGNTGAGR